MLKVPNIKIEKQKKPVAAAVQPPISKAVFPEKTESKKFNMNQKLLLNFLKNPTNTLREYK